MRDRKWYDIDDILRTIPIPEAVKGNDSHFKVNDSDWREVMQQKKHIQTLDSKISKMKRTVERYILHKGVTLGDIQNNEVKGLITTCQEEVYKAYTDAYSLQRLFWEQQMKFKGSGNGMRWHPMIIHLCLLMPQ
ncbi:Hypothetical predicted protein [Mytilus galloprovincialis]|uniref:Uncharacterized protein n=1 Tax=Mytilus galloprovincialis TaxID=29158 RepID=A0A8B6G165_MYTGA|nr:Hypothetical predicted protein [Mytilus galloprovincialis]